MSYQGALSGFFIPSYPEMSSGDWRFSTIMLGGQRGYEGEMHPMQQVSILLGPSENGSDSWMSSTAVEMESQADGVAAARGEVVVFGMGMGWATMNCALREEVSRVTVVDRSPDVIKLIREAAIFEQLPAAAREKIAIVEGDGLEWRPDCQVNTLLADIWLKQIEPGKFDQARRMQENVQAEQVHIWGQDLEIWRHCCRRRGHEGAPDRALIDQVVAEDIRLPLILPDIPDLGARLARIAEHWGPVNEGWWRE